MPGVFTEHAGHFGVAALPQVRSGRARRSRRSGREGADAPAGPVGKGPTLPQVDSEDAGGLFGWRQDLREGC
ncbi:hypothetical protein BJQ89_00689 [Arthrobacter sp. ES1]|nr:hypothetical protein [Arthrobacter sp. ES1]